MYCWGSTTSGELGLGGIEESQVRRPRHLAFPAGTTVVQVACGYDHTLFRTADGAVFSCGNNDRGQLGHGEQHTRPVRLESLENYPVKQVAAGDQLSLAVTQWGGLFAWGDNRHRQLGTDDSVEFQQRPRQLRAFSSKRVVQAACGQSHCLALTDDGDVLAWGCNEHGQLGLGERGSPVSRPQLVKTLAALPLGRIACGGHHSLALTKCGRVLAWGRNTFHQLGVSGEQDVARPVPVRALGTQRVRHLTAGENHSAVLTQDGAVFTFGAGTYGQLGHGGKCNEVNPRQVIELMGSKVTQLVCGRQHTLVYVDSGGGKVMAFGLGASGQLGLTELQVAKTPQVVVGPWTSDRDPGPSQASALLRLAGGGHQSFVIKLADPELASLADDRLWLPDSQILELTEEAAQSLRDQTTADPDQRHRLIEYAETVLGSVACLNGSFLPPGGQHHICTSLEPNMDMAACEATMRTLHHVTNDTFMELVQTKLALLPLSLPPRPPDAEALRVYVILMMSPDFAAFSSPFGDALLQLSERDWIVLSGWLRQLPAGPLLSVLAVYKEAVLRYIKKADTLIQCRNGSWQVGGRLQATLRTLRRLHAALLGPPATRAAGAEPPPPAAATAAAAAAAAADATPAGVTEKAFYIPELTELVSVPLDYVGWQLAPNGSSGDYFCHYPFVFDASAKSQLLQTDALLQMRSAMELAASQQMANMFLTGDSSVSQFLQLTVSREHLVEETLQQLSQKTNADLKKPLRVKFFDEEGEDAGGVRKEFFLVLIRELLDPKYGMFSEFGETNTIWFNPDSYEEGVMYFLIGIVCGLAIYNSTIVNLPFPLALYKKLLEQPLTLEDLAGLSPITAKDVLDYTEEDLPEVFCLMFEVTREVYGRMETTELKPGGSTIPVTQANKHEYVQLYVDHMLNKSIEKQYQAFQNGFYKVCGSKVLQLFTAPELMTLVTGDENYDWQVFEQNTEYREGYSRDSLPVKLFWQVFHSLTLEQKKRFLLFLTGTDRVPIAGMKAIKMYVQPCKGGDNFLPVAHTCFNLLDLPEYSTAEKLRYKLLQAIQCTEGFALV